MLNWGRIIAYRDFYDVPRAFLVRHGGRWLFFECRFNEAIDDYPDEYDVYVVPELPDVVVSGSWGGLSNHAVERLGKIPVSTVRFDETRKAAVDLAALEMIGGGQSD